LKPPAVIGDQRSNAATACIDKFLVTRFLEF
jgi:hypothetical protein